MKKWLLTASTDGSDVNFSVLIDSDTEPGFWELYTLAESHGCTFFNVMEVPPNDC